MKENRISEETREKMYQDVYKRQVEYLSRQGILFNMETAKYQDGKLILLYLKEEIGGFAVHLIQQ